MVQIDPDKKALPATDAKPWRVASCGEGFDFVFQLGGGVGNGGWDVGSAGERRDS